MEFTLFNSTSINEMSSTVISHVENVDVINTLLFVFGFMSFAKICADFGTLICGPRYTVVQHTAEIVALEQRMVQMFEAHEEILGQILAQLSSAENSQASQEEEQAQEVEEEQAQEVEEEQAQEVGTEQVQTDTTEEQAEETEEQAQEEEAANQDSPDDDKSLQSIEQINEIVAAPVSADDKHALLRKRFKNGQAVFLTYKKTTFTAKFIVDAKAQHGYVLRSDSVDYQTPSHFSYAKKSGVNPNIHSDNGWDSVYVLVPTNGKEKKCSLKEFIQMPAST